LFKVWLFLNISIDDCWIVHEIRRYSLIESSWCIAVTSCFIAEVDPEQNLVFMILILQFILQMIQKCMKSKNICAKILWSIY